MATEQVIQRKMSKWLESQGVYLIKTIATTKAGVPDIVGCYKGTFIGIEVKHPDKRTNVSALQQHNLDKIVDAGGYSMVAWELQQVIEFIGDIDELN